MKEGQMGRRPMRNVRWVAATAIALGLACSCTSNAKLSPVRVTHATTVPGEGITLDAVRAGVKPKLSAESAYAICRSPRGPACVSGRRPLIQLAYVTDTQTGTQLPDGTMQLTMNHTLAY